MHTRELAVSALVRRRHQPKLGGNLSRTLPERRELDVVDPAAPSIPLDEVGLAPPIVLLHLVERAACQLAHRNE
jgi:hypothetical protein